MKRKGIGIVLVIALLGLRYICSLPIPAQADAADAWWDDAWPYRIPVTVSGTGVVEVAIDFTAAFNTLGLNHALLDARSIRVVAYAGDAPSDTLPYAETYSTLLEDAESPQIGWSSSGVYWRVNDGSAEADSTRAAHGSGSLKATVENQPGGYGYPGVELLIADGDPRTDWSAYEVLIYDVWPEVNASAQDQAPDLYWYKLYNACDGDSVTQGGPPLALDQWNAASVSLNPLDSCWPSDGLDLSNITRMEFHTRDNETVNGNSGFWDDGDVLTLWFDNLRLVDQDTGTLRWQADGSTDKYYVYFDTLRHEGHPRPSLDESLGPATLIGTAGVPEAGGYYHQITEASPGDLALWAAPSVEKVLKTMVVPVAKAPLHITAARGEFEPFQLVARAPSAQSLNVSISDFIQGTAVITDITLHRVDYVNITTAGDHFDRFGWWPDPLFPLDNGAAVSFPANENQPLWFTVHVPWDAAPGIYQATVTVGSATVPVELEVWDFALPRQLHLDSEWGFGWSHIVEDVYQGYGDWECYWDIVEAFKQDFINHRLIPKSVGWPAGIPYTWFDCATDTLEVGTPDDPWYFTYQGNKYVLGQGFNDGYGFPAFLAFGPASNWPPDSRPSSFCSISRGEDPPASSTYNARWQAYLSALDAYITDPRHDFSAQAYAHIVNEPQTFSDYDVVAYLARMYKQHAPHLRLLLSEQVEDYIYNNPTYGPAKIDIWMPTISSYEPVKSHDRQKNHDEEVWWYYLYGDDPPLPNPILMSHPGIEARITPWLAWAERVDGLLHYDATDWDPNPWTTPNVTGKDNGDGFFFYPPRQDGSNLDVCGQNGHRLVPSIRWENLRDGMEDYEYLWLLAGGDPQIDVVNAADYVVADLVSSRTRFSHVPTDLIEARAAIARALAPAPDAPSKLQITGPSEGFIQTTYTLSATVNPTATLPLTITWAPTDWPSTTRQIQKHEDIFESLWLTSGTKYITVTVANAVGSVTGVHTLTIKQVPSTTVSSTFSGTLVYTDGQGNPTAVYFPAGAIITETEFYYTPLTMHGGSFSPTLSFDGHVFLISPYQPNVDPANFNLLKPITITINYSDQDIAHLKEVDLRIHNFYPDSYMFPPVDVARTCYEKEQGTGSPPPEALERYYTRWPDQNRIAVQVCRLRAYFGLAGSPKDMLYLPLVLRVY